MFSAVTDIEWSSVADALQLCVDCVFVFSADELCHSQNGSHAEGAHRIVLFRPRLRLSCFPARIDGFKLEKFHCSAQKCCLQHRDR